MTWTRRSHGVSHSKDGWHLEVRDERWAGLIAERVTETALAALGHPCCGRGPLARLTLRYRALSAIGITWGQAYPGEDWQVDPDENALDLFWFTVLNLPNKLHGRFDTVVSAPISAEQAAVLAPDFVKRVAQWDAEDDDEETV